MTTWRFGRDSVRGALVRDDDGAGGDDGVLVTFAVVIPLLHLFFRGRLQVDENARRAVMELDAAASIRDTAELRRSGAVLVLTILAFFAHQALHVEPATVALTGAAIALLLTRVDLDEVLSGIEWPTSSSSSSSGSS